MRNENQKKKIFVVDDDESIVDILRDSLTQLGYQFAGACASGEDTLTRLATDKPDLILMDIGLAGKMDGLDTAKIIQSKYDIPVVYITGHYERHVLDRARVCDQFGMVLKPFKIKEIHVTIEMALAKYASEKKIKESEQWLVRTLNSIEEGLIATDHNNHIKFINPIAEKLTGWRLEDALGRPLNEVLHLHLGGEKNGLVPIEGAPLTFNANRVMNRSLLIAKSGRAIPIDYKSSPIKSSMDATWGSVLVLNDISEYVKTESEMRHEREELEKRIIQSEEELEKRNSELLGEIRNRKRIETFLNQSKEQFKTIYEQSPIGIALFNADCELVSMNHACKQIFGIRQDMEGIDYNFTKDPNISPKVLANMGEEKSIVREIPYNFNKLKSAGLFTTNKNGIVHLRLYITPLGTMETGKVGGYLLQYQDISHQKQYEHTLKSLNKYNEIKANLWKRAAHHDLKNENDLVRELLQVVGSALRVKRASFFQYVPEKKSYIATQQWHEKGSSSTIGESVAFRMARFFFGYRYLELPGDISLFVRNSSIRKIVMKYIQNKFSKNGITSCLMISYGNIDNPAGIFVFSDELGERVWNDFEKRLLTDMVSFVSMKAEQLQAEMALRESKKRYHALFQTANDGIFIMQQDKFIECNPKTLKIFGCKKEQIINQSPYRFSPPYQPDGRDSRTKALELIKMAMDGKPQFFEWRHIRYDGTPFEAEVSLNAVRLSDEKFLQAIVRDITDRKHAEEEIQRQLKEKKAMLKEIHHRVKNNMQVISSLLSLQSNYVDGKDVKAILLDSYNRVRTMSLIHEKLYQSEDLGNIDFVDYIESFISHLLLTYSDRSKHITLKHDIENIVLDIHLAIPCGLVINELVTNALKHAFPGDKEGTIEIRLNANSKDGRASLVIKDDGVGLPDSKDNAHPNTLGLQLVNTLVDQLHGEMRMESRKGACYRITFPLD